MKNGALTRSKHVKARWRARAVRSSCEIPACECLSQQACGVCAVRFLEQPRNADTGLRLICISCPKIKRRAFDFRPPWGAVACEAPGYQGRGPPRRVVPLQNGNASGTCAWVYGNFCNSRSVGRVLRAVGPQSAQIFVGRRSNRLLRKNSSESPQRLALKLCSR